MTGPSLSKYSRPSCIRAIHFQRNRRPPEWDGASCDKKRICPLYIQPPEYPRQIRIGKR